MMRQKKDTHKHCGQYNYYKVLKIHVRNDTNMRKTPGTNEQTAVNVYIHIYNMINLYIYNIYYNYIYIYITIFFSGSFVSL